MMDKRTKILLTVLIMLSLITTSSYIYISEESDEYMTIKEAAENGALSATLPNGTVFHMQDKVIYSYIFRLPEALEEPSHTVDMENIRTYTAV